MSYMNDIFNDQMSTKGENELSLTNYSFTTESSFPFKETNIIKLINLMSGKEEFSFKNEFPSEDEKNNSLYKAYEAYKYKNNFDIFFYFISCILLVWSFAHFILQILVYCEIQKIRKYYIINGIILFLIKLISLFGMIIYHFWYFLKIEKVYHKLEDVPEK